MGLGPRVFSENAGLIEAQGSPTAYWGDDPFQRAFIAGRSTIDPNPRKEEYKIATSRMCEDAPAAMLFSSRSSMRIPGA